MELITKKKLMLFSGRANVPLATEIAESLGVPLGEVELSTFANGEIYCRYLESIRGADVFIVQSHSTPINEHLFEQLIMIDAAKRASAKRITAVCPFYGYAPPVVVPPAPVRVKLPQPRPNPPTAALPITDKPRPRHNVAVASVIVGDVVGRPCVLIDDMIDTAGTITSAAELLIDRGASV